MVSLVVSCISCRTLCGFGFGGIFCEDSALQGLADQRLLEPPERMARGRGISDELDWDDCKGGESCERLVAEWCGIVLAKKSQARNTITQRV